MVKYNWAEARQIRQRETLAAATRDWIARESVERPRDEEPPGEEGDDSDEQL